MPVFNPKSIRFSYLNHCLSCCMLGNCCFLLHEVTQGSNALQTRTLFSLYWLFYVAESFHRGYLHKCLSCITWSFVFCPAVVCLCLSVELDNDWCHLRPDLNGHKSLQTIVCWALDPTHSILLCLVVFVSTLFCFPLNVFIFFTHPFLPTGVYCWTFKRI